MSISHGSKRFKNALRPNRKHFILMKPGNLKAVGTNALKKYILICQTTWWLSCQNLQQNFL